VDAWKTSITTSDESNIWIYGHSVAGMMRDASFTDVVFLLHRGQLPLAAERRLFDAMLIAVSDHGPGSPSAAASRIVATANRAAPEAAVAAGLLAVGDMHAGAGLACFNLIATSIERARREGRSLHEVARLVALESKSGGHRLPGLGHRTHRQDPRTVVLLQMARELGVAGTGVDFLTSLESAAAEEIKPLPANIDGAIAAVLYDLRFSAVMAKFIFMIGRVAGLTAQVNEEYTRERPMRIRIPVTYDGPPPAATGGAEVGRPAGNKEG
jgi:citrate synthase